MVVAWRGCGCGLEYNAERVARVVIYNGDWDSCVPYTDNQAWTMNMGYPVSKPWHPWMYSVSTEGQTSQQVAGCTCQDGVAWPSSALIVVP
jgi:hypothetical protein